MWVIDEHFSKHSDVRVCCVIIVDWEHVWRMVASLTVQAEGMSKPCPAALRLESALLSLQVRVKYQVSFV